MSVGNSLQTIRTKVRRLTRSPSLAQLSDADIDQYVNTFLLYDFPEHLRLFSLRTTLTFYTNPGVDVYAASTDPANPLFNFNNIYVAIHPPAYIAGVAANFTQWRDVFFGQWPLTNQVTDTLIQCTGISGPYSGIVNNFPQAPTFVPSTSSGAILQHSFIISALDANNNAMVLVDQPTTIPANPQMGVLVQPYSVQADPPPPNPLPTFGTINYVTGAFTVNFPAPTLASATNTIIVEYIPYIPGLPISMLYYNNEFTLRPVPDKAYSVSVEADVRPTQLILSNSIPQIEQWWQFIAYGAAKKVFEDRMDMDSVQMILPEYRNQMNFVNRTSLTQQVNQRTTTIYTEGKQWSWGWNYSSNFPF